MDDPKEAIREAFRAITTIGAAKWNDAGYDQLGRDNPYADKKLERDFWKEEAERKATYEARKAAGQLEVWEKAIDKDT